MAKVPVLIGSSGFIAGESFVLTDPCDVVIGRSRSCDISLQASARYQSLPDDERARLEDFNSVSRRHVRLAVVGTRARLENLAQGGTVLNDARFDRSAETDLAQGPAVIRLSAFEALTLVLAERDNLEEMLAKTRPLPGSGSAPTRPAIAPAPREEPAHPATAPSQGTQDPSPA